MSWASELIEAKSVSSNLIFTTLLCWSGKTAILSNESINFYVLKFRILEKESGINCE